MMNLTLWLGLTVLVVLGLVFWYFLGAPASAPTPTATTTPSALTPPPEEGAFGRETTAPLGSPAVAPTPAPAPVDDSIFKG